MRYSQLVPLGAAGILVLNLVTLSAPGASAAQRGGNELCVAVSGGIVENATVLDVVADGGTGISDASGGTGNLAVASESGDGKNDNRRNDNNRNNNNNNNNRNNNRRDWSAESVPMLEVLFQQDTASSGNAGVATAGADGGAVSIEDVNSGGNAGNAISVGDTVCGAAAPAHSGGSDKGGGNVSGGGGRGGQVTRLPKTGIGVIDAGTSGSLALALGALGMAGLAFGFRNDRRFFQAGGR